MARKVPRWKIEQMRRQGEAQKHRERGEEAIPEASEKHPEQQHPYQASAPSASAAEPLPAVEPTTTMHACPACRAEVASKAGFCSHCGYDLTSAASQAAPSLPGYPGLEKTQQLALAGAALLVFGVFAPIVSIPIMGNLNYFQNGKGDGTIVLILAVASIILALRKRYDMLWATGIASLAVMTFTFTSFQVRMWQIRADLDRDLANNPFRGIADLAIQSIQLQWGWVILLAGAALVIAAAAWRARS